MKKTILVSLMVLLSLPLAAQGYRLVEFRIESSQPAFNNIESLAFHLEQERVIYSGLNVQGQLQSYQIYPSTEEPLSSEELLELRRYTMGLEGRLKAGLAMISPESRSYPRLVFVYRNSRGTEQNRYYRFPNPTQRNNSLYELTERFTGHSFWESLNCRYD